MDFDAILTNLNPVTIASVTLAGISLGLYFTFLADLKAIDSFRTWLTSFIVIGFSFYFPFAFSSMITNPDANPLRFVGSMVLWLIFSFATAMTYHSAVGFVRK